MRSQTWKNNNIKHLEFVRLQLFCAKFCSFRMSPYVETHDTVNMRLQSHLMEPIIIYSVRVQCTKGNIAAGDDNNKTAQNSAHSHSSFFGKVSNLVVYHNDNNSVMFSCVVKTLLSNDFNMASQHETNKLYQMGSIHERIWLTSK